MNVDLTKIERADSPEDPKRCQAIAGKDQCMNKAALLQDGTRGQFCRVHGGNRAQEKQEKQNIHHYRAAKWRQKIRNQADSPGIKSLREEIGILRMLLDERLEMCDDRIGLMTHSAVLADLVIKVDKLVNSCHKLEGSLGELLDKKALIQFTGIVISILMEELAHDDPEIQEHIDIAIAKIAERLTNEVITLNVDTD